MLLSSKVFSQDSKGGFISIAIEPNLDFTSTKSGHGVRFHCDS